MTLMLPSARRVRLRYSVFLSLALLINLVDTALARSTVDARRRLIFAAGSSVDIVLVVAALYYWLLVRPGIRTKASITLVMLLGAVRAGFLFPEGNVKVILAGVCELGFIATAMMYVRQARKTCREAESDPVAVIRATMQSILPLPVAVKALSAELAIVYYALFSWRAKPHVPPDTQPFTNFRKIGHADLFAVLPFVGIVEIVPVHLLFAHWKKPAAWVITVLSVYSLIWMAGLARAFHLRPTLIGPDYIYLRYGLMFQLKAPATLIAHACRALNEDAAYAVPRTAEPTHSIRFTREVAAERLFGFEKRLTQVALTVDDPHSFELALARYRIAYSHVRGM